MCVLRVAGVCPPRRDRNAADGSRVGVRAESSAMYGYRIFFYRRTTGGSSIGPLTCIFERCRSVRYARQVGTVCVSAGEVVGPLCVGRRRRRCACRDRSAASAQVGRLCAGRLRGLRAARAVGVLCVAVAVHVPGAVAADHRPGCGVPTARCPSRPGPGRPIMCAADSGGWRRLAPSVAGLARPGRRLMRGPWPLTVGLLCVG